MNHSNYFVAAAFGIFLPLAMGSCFDNSIDLDNLNKDYEVKVNNLVVPIKLDNVTLSNIIDIEDDGILRIVNDEYVLVKEGDISGDGFYVSTVSLSLSVQEVSATIPTGEIPALGNVSVPFDLALPALNSTFKFETSAVDGRVRGLKSAKCDCSLVLNFEVPANLTSGGNVHIADLNIKVPENLHVEGYKRDGENLQIGSVSFVNGIASVTLKITGIDFETTSSMNFSFTPGATISDNGTLAISGGLGISGRLAGEVSSSSIPSGGISFALKPYLSNVDVKAVSGSVEFTFGGLSLSDIYIDDMPSVLEDAKAELQNPQIYVKMNNPLADYGMTGSTRLSFKSYFNDELAFDATSSILELGKQGGSNAEHQYCIAEFRPSAYYGPYSSAEFVSISNLSGLIGPNGFSGYRLNVSTDDPRMSGDVTDFPLGSTLPAIRGGYSFFSPVALRIGSSLTYSEQETGWDDETVRKMRIDHLNVSADVNNSLPFDITLSGTPLNANGEPCVDVNTRQPVTIGPVTIKANGTSHIDLKTSGVITNLDGIAYKAEGNVTEETGALKPSSPIHLTNIRVTVSGSYRDSF